MRRENQNTDISQEKTMTLYSCYVQRFINLNNRMLLIIQNAAKKLGYETLAYQLFNLRQMYDSPAYKNILLSWTEKHNLFLSWKEMLCMSEDFKEFMKDCYQFGENWSKSH